MGNRTSGAKPGSKQAWLTVVAAALLAPLGAFGQDVGHWEPRASMPRAVDEPRGVALDDKIYIFGGIEETGMLPLGIVLVYDSEEDEWEQREDMPSPGHHLMLTKHDGKIYVFGGFNLSDEIYAWQAMDDAWEYTPETNTWRELPPMPAGPRGAGEAVELDGKIYVIGGAGPWPGESPALEFNGNHEVTGRVEVFDPATETWSTAKTMPTPRNHFSAAAANGKIYSVGGRQGSTYIVYSSNTAVVEEYDPKTDSWSLKKYMPTERSGTGVTSYNGKVYVAGGEFQSDALMAAFRVFEAYDPANNTWNSSLPRMPVPRHGFVGIQMGNEFHVLGGGFQSAGVERVNVITETHDVFIFED